MFTVSIPLSLSFSVTRITLNNLSVYPYRLLVTLTTSPVSTWTRFAVPVQYFSGDTPDLAVSLLSSSFGFSAIAGSELWVDDLELIYNPAGVDDIDNLTSVFYANKRLSWKGDHHFTSISIYNLNGQLIIDHQNLNDNSLDLMLKKGLYLVNLKSDEGVFTKKLSVR